MTINWKLKIESLLSRMPGRETLTSADALIAQADRVAFAFDRPPQVIAFDAAPCWQNLRVVHPLSAQPRGLPAWTPEDWQIAQAALGARVAEIQRDYPVQDARQFAMLWRALPTPPPAIHPDMQAWWRLLPADPRAPTANLWDHQALVSALVGTARADRLQPALLQFNLAGAQDFIVSARRTQDLWAGSFLIAYISWAAIRYLSVRYGPDCILQPGLRGQPLVDLWLHEELKLNVPNNSVGKPACDAAFQDDLFIASIPNIFTAIVPADEMQDAAEKAVEAAQREWERISGDAYAYFHGATQGRYASDSRLNDTWTRQQSKFLQGLMFWAAVPLPADSLSRGEGAAWLDAHKRFLPLLQPEAGRNLSTLIEDTRSAAPSEATGGLLYGPCSAVMARLLQDRKRVRDFVQTEEEGQKCTLCGLRSAIHPNWNAAPELDAIGEHISQGKLQRWWDGLRARERQPYKLAGRLRAGDRLCAVCFTRRMIMDAHFDAHAPRPTQQAYTPMFDRHQFPSTAGIANAAFIRDLMLLAAKDANVLEAMRAYNAAVKNLFKQNEFFESSPLDAWKKARDAAPDTTTREVLQAFMRTDGEYLYPESCDAQTLTREFKRDFDANNVAAVREACKTLLKAGKSAGQPSRYYAILAVDGDRMGKWVGGLLPAQASLNQFVHPACVPALGKDAGSMRRPLGPATHMALSDALNGFSLADARRIVEQDNIGKLIFAGGDDVLALVPLDSLLPTLRQLYESFRGDVGGGAARACDGFVMGKQGWELRMGPEATLSAGVAIVHEGTPLTQAMEEARGREHHAKDGLGRDAFAVALLKRSGAPLHIGARWHTQVDSDLGLSLDVVAAVQTATALMRTEDKRSTLSSKLPYTMQQTPLEMQPGVWQGGTLPAARRGEFRRIVERHLGPLPGIESGNGASRIRYETSKEQRKAFLADFSSLLGIKQDPEMATAGKDDGAWQQVIGLLLLARMISGEERD